MTKDEAVKIWVTFGSSRVEAELRERLPQRAVDRIISENAEDCIEGFIALGMLKVTAPSPQDNAHD